MPVTGRSRRKRSRGVPREDGERYVRQIPVPGIGVAGQARLRDSSVVVLGVGGLGCPALLYLAAAGVGRVTLVDDDQVSPSNLNRQVLFTARDVGRPKVTVARRRLRALNPQVEWTGVTETLAPALARRLVAGADVVLDCADNHTARRVLAAAAHAARVPLVHGAVAGLEGHVAVFAGGGRPCFSCLYAEPFDDGTPPPVLGATAGVIGVLMTVEVIRLVLGLGPPRTGQILVADLERGTFEWFTVPPRDDCPWCRVG